MKKKIILFLTFLLTAMFLTGCATTKTTANELSKLNNVANEIASEGPGYKLPDGYELAYSDSKDTSRISITCTTEQKDEITAEYVIEGKEAHLDSFEIENTAAVELDGMFICFFIGLIIGIIITFLAFLSD